MHSTVESFSPTSFPDDCDRKYKSDKDDYDRTTEESTNAGKMFVLCDGRKRRQTLIG